MEHPQQKGSESVTENATTGTWESEGPHPGAEHHWIWSGERIRTTSTFSEAGELQPSLHEQSDDAGEWHPAMHVTVRRVDS